MSPACRNWLVESASEIAGMSAAGKTVREIRGRMLRIVEKTLPMAPARVKRQLISAAMDAVKKARGVPVRDPEAIARFLAYTPEYDQLRKAANRADRAIQSLAKAQIASGELEKGRSELEPTVFYLTSHHQVPAEGHRDLQSVIAYDRMYRSVLTAAGMWWKIGEIEKFIRDGDMPSIQELLGPPTYWMTRPYCRHRFVPLPTQEVLSGYTGMELARMHPESADGAHRSKSPVRLRREDRQRRNDIVSRASKYKKTA